MGVKTLLAVPLICGLAYPAAAQGDAMLVQGESLVLTGAEPGNLCFEQVVQGSLTLRSTYVAGLAGSVVYAEGRDYVVDYARGTLARTPDSRIKDFATNCLYGQKDFDHNKFPGFSNHPWFVWADYRTAHGQPWADSYDRRRVMAEVRRKLEAGGPFKIASYGDSITAGGEASEPRFRFQQRYAAYLQARFPMAQITVEDASISGYASQQGIDWFDQYLGKVEHPDLVLVGFGMNDHNLGGPEPAQFTGNLVALVNLIRERKGAAVVLFSAFPPNEDWHHGTHRMARYAEAAQQAAAEAGCAYVDVFSTWARVLRRKDQPSLLGNNINHPNDFGHWLYEQAFEAMEF